jgi:hypothetical protein
MIQLHEELEGNGCSRPSRCDSPRPTRGAAAYGRTNLRITRSRDMIRAVTPEGPSLPNADTVAVVFVFPDSSEIRYLSNPPPPGARVQSSTGQRFRVAGIRASGEHTFRVRCVVEAVAPTRAMARRDPIKTREDETGHSGAIDDLASQLLGVVRGTMESAARLRRRYRMRHYIP